MPETNPPRGGSGIQREKAPSIVHIVSHSNDAVEVDKIVTLVTEPVTADLKSHAQTESIIPDLWPKQEQILSELSPEQRQKWDTLSEPQKETVNHPSHYNQGQYEAIEIIRDAGFSEGFCIGNALKYILRFKYKNGLEYLKKARWYLDYYIRELEPKTETITPPDGWEPPATEETAVYFPDHSPECGRNYQGCAPDCPKAQWEARQEGKDNA